MIVNPDVGGGAIANPWTEVSAQEFISKIDVTGVVWVQNKIYPNQQFFISVAPYQQFWNLNGYPEFWIVGVEDDPELSSTVVRMSGNGYAPDVGNGINMVLEFLTPGESLTMKYPDTVTMTENITARFFVFNG